MIRHVKEIAPDTVVVMISGMQTVESAIGVSPLGAFDYLMKPFDLRQVEAVVKRALEHHDLVVAKQRYENHLEELVEQRTIELDKALNSLEAAYRSTLKALTAATETRDSETHGHSERVVTYSLRLGREYGLLSSDEMKALEFGCSWCSLSQAVLPRVRPPKTQGVVETRRWTGRTYLWSRSMRPGSTRRSATRDHHLLLPASISRSIRATSAHARTDDRSRGRRPAGTTRSSSTQTSRASFACEVWT